MSSRVFGLVDALLSLTPLAVWSFEEETYESLKWQDEAIPKPSKEEVEAEIVRLTEQAELDRIAAIEAEEAKQAAKESALAKLAKLGLTEEEARAVIGM